jgi:NAD(P)H-nitrite reductase large subunit
LFKAAKDYMTQVERISETINTYRKHGWRLERVLLRPETSIELSRLQPEIFEDATLQEATVDALWFARLSHAGREAWELRLVAETPYALFETFEIDEAEEDREEVRREMEARLREYAALSRIIPRPS